MGMNGTATAGMVVHLYAQCWNDGWMLPFFFRHYDALVDRYFMFDDNSTDDTLSILRRHPKVQLASFVRSHPNSFVRSEQSFSNECWKRSRGIADWVIVTDVDEHLFHPQGRAYLAWCAERNVTIIPALGFQMVSETRPAGDETLSESCTYGAPWERMMKTSIFDPDEITEINFSFGRHRAAPTGCVRLPPRDEMLLFHYKYMGFVETHDRHKQLETGLGSEDAERGWGHKYAWSTDQLKADWDEVVAKAVDTMAMRQDPSAQYPGERWWERYRS
jgi:hypothetical protein